MKKVTVLKGLNIEVKPFLWEDYASKKQKPNKVQKVSKKEIKSLAKELGLDVNDKKIAFAKKLLNAYIKKNR